jgi:enoyl-CoA hydratase
MTETIRYQKDENGIATITFNRPDALNALTLTMMDRFAAVVQDVAQDDSIRVILLTGAGDSAFSSGGDLRELSERPTEAQAREFITTMGDALYTLEHIPVPVIAAINGYALGGGSEIAVACDLRVCDDKVRMAFVQIRWALTPGWGGGQRLLRLVGYSKAMDLMLRGHVMHAPEVEALGIANKIVETGTAYTHSYNIAKHIAQHPPDAVRATKTLLRAGLEHPYDEALRIERDLFPPLWAADEHLQAVDDFLAKQQQRREEKDDGS